MPRPEYKREWDRRHRADANARNRDWPWRQAAAAVKQARRTARAHGLPEGGVSKEVMARLHLLPCAYCGAMPAREADHVRPLRLGGTNTLDNLAPACRSCNARRGSFVLNEIVGRSSPANDLWPPTDVAP